MNQSFQELFLRSRGKPIVVNGREVCQMTRIPIRRGLVRIRFNSTPDGTQGICVRAKGGWVELSDGSRSERLMIWNEPGLPNSITHRVNCPEDELLIWNVYRVHHPTGEVTEDSWTGNAGMVLVYGSSGYRRFECSDWRNPFDPSVLTFEIEWKDDGTDPKQS